MEILILAVCLAPLEVFEAKGAEGGHSTLKALDNQGNLLEL